MGAAQRQFFLKKVTVNFFGGLGPGGYLGGNSSPGIEGEALKGTPPFLPCHCMKKKSPRVALHSWALDSRSLACRIL